jgi:hypothetical protein
MEILKRSVPAVWQIEHLCTERNNGGNGCNSLLSIIKEDLVYYPGVNSESWGASDPAVSFKCPVCNACTDLRKKDWPRWPASLKNVGAVWYRKQDNIADSGDK